MCIFEVFQRESVIRDWYIGDVGIQIGFWIVLWGLEIVDGGG